MEFDLPFVIVTNLTPYAIAAVVLAVRRGGHVRRWPALLVVVAALYALAMVLAPIGGIGAVARAREGWGGYAFLFVVLGTLTWISFAFWWLAFAAWTDRLRSVRGRDTSAPAFFMYRRSGPVLSVTTALVAGLMPWLWPATTLPGGNLWLIPFAVLGFGLAVLAGAVNVSERAPRFLLPRDLASQPQPAGQPFWDDILFVALGILLGGVAVLAIQSSTHWSLYVIWVVILPVVFVAGLVAHAVSRLVSRLVLGRGRQAGCD